MAKWSNVDAGPRQLKDLKDALSKLAWEGKMHDELTGVIGGSEDSHSYMSMMAPVRAEVVALEDEIVARYSGQVTRATVRAIIDDYLAAVPEARKSRPVEDKRRSAEEDNRINAMMAERAEIAQLQAAERDAMRNQVMAKAPAGASRIILAEYHEDKSNPQADYFASHTARTVAIGWGYGTREDFRALRSAASTYLGAEAASVLTEHRDTHSMGAGNYLSDHGWAGSGTGWLIKSRKLPAGPYLDITEDAIPAPSAPVTVPDATASNGITVRPSSIGREGVVEIVFADRPSPEMLLDVKAHGFRWAKGNRCWYGRDAGYARQLAGIAS